MIARVFFVRFLTAEYLGLSNLFTNILSVFSLVELGIGPAMTFSLYEPLAHQDVEKIKSLMQLYKKAYRGVGILLLILGVCGLSFYRFFMESVPDIPHLDLIYLLFVFNTAISYFYSYKRSLIITDQRRYIATFFRYGFYIILNIVQIFALWLTKSYLLFLLVQILFTWTENFCISKTADRMYPYLKEKKVYPLEKKELSRIKRDIGAMVFHKIGGLSVNSTDNIILTKFLGLVVSGVYSNYALIIQALKMVTQQFFQSLIASVGNLKASAEEQKVLSVFYRILFLSFWLFSFVSIGLGILVNPFVKLWLGPEYCLDSFTAMVLAMNFFFYAVRQAVLTFRDATGTYYYDRYKPLFEAAINLVASVLLVQKWGVAGIFLGTMLGFLLTGFWVEPFVLYKHVFHCSLKGYFKKYFFYLSVALFAAWITWGASVWVGNGGLDGFILQFLICIVVPNAIFLLVFHRTPEFVYFWELSQKLFVKVRGLLSSERSTK
ncbi:lipopolysaccharide biosynthesis protein [uncultured Ruthenibacterium sp.]|uniref:lipopolysaccharide biosynthesis protein n=1 Tax=uncultured Ruthenibacterium sp. TaxID=1905347 RepID=UPI00349E8C10